MRNYQKNATMNHSAAMKDLAGSFYEGIFIDSAIGDNRNPAIVECLSSKAIAWADTLCRIPWRRRLSTL